MFQVGEAIVYPGYGAGEVQAITRLSALGSRRGASGSEKRYYSIVLLDGTDTQVYVPVKDAEGKGVRRPIPPSRLDEVWRELRSEPQELPSDYQERYAIIRDRLQEGDAAQIAGALRDLSWKDSHVRSLTSEGKRLYDKALAILSSEVAVVQGAERERVALQISDVLNQNSALREQAARA